MDTLPIKTKIAAWWMIIIGLLSFVIVSIQIMIIMSLSYNEPPYGLESFLIIMACGMIVIFAFLPSGFFILQRKKWAWKFSIIILLISMVIFLFGGTLISIRINPLHNVFDFLYFFWPRNFGIPFLVALVSFILLLFDRKNFKQLHF